MKLPGSVKTGVRGLAFMPSGADAALAKGAAFADIGQTVGGIVNKIETERDNEEVRQLNLSMMQSQAEFDNSYNKPSYTASEIPEGIDIRLNDKQFVGGQEVSTPRQDIPAYEVKAQIYNQEMTRRIKSGAETITTPSVRAEWLKDKEALVELNTTKLVGQAEADQREYNAKKLTLDINDAMQTGSFDVALALTADIKNPDSRVAARKEIKTTRELNEYDALILDKENPESWVGLQESIEMLRDDEQNSMLTTEQRVSEADKLERALIQGKQDFVIAEKSVIANAAADVKVDLDGGSVNYTDEEFKKQRDKGLLTNAQYIGYTKQLNANKIKLEKSQKAKYEIQAGYVDPKNTEHMKAVDEEFAKLAQASDPWQAAQKIVQKYNVLAPSVNNAFNMANITGGASLTDAAIRYTILNETNPVAMTGVKAERVQQVAAYMQLGMSPADALESLSFNESLTDSQLDTKKAMFAGKDNMDKSTKALTTLFNESFNDFDLFSTDTWGAPDVPVFMAAEFTAITEANLAKAGFNINIARRMAFNSIKGKYKPTSINGSIQVLPYMPQEPDELVRKQIKSQLGDGVIIQSDQLTENQVMMGNEVSYMAYKDLGDGNIEILDRYKYDSKAIQATQVKEQEAKQKKILDEALREREEIEAKKARAKARKERDTALEKSYRTKVDAQRKESLAETFVREVGL